MRKAFTAIAAAILALVSGVAAAGPVPSSYTFDAGTDSGSWGYHDPTYSKLTDGQLGYAGWANDFGSKWVGWLDDEINIDFTFSGLTAISGVRVGSTQDNLSDVVLPSVKVSQWVSGNWVLAGSLTVPPSAANNVNEYSTAAHGFLDLLGLNIYSDMVRVTLTANGPFTFTDEITFDHGEVPANQGNQGNPLPEPRTLALMTAGLGLMALGRRRQTQQRGH